MADLRNEYHVRQSSDVGAAIALLRKQHGHTQAEAAKAVGLSPSYLAKIEQGRSVSLLEHQLRALHRLGAEVTISWPEPE